jgi:hypothetical protein
MRGYLVRPAKTPGKLPAVLVIHENRGLNPHIEDVARRIALEGFMAFAPDALFPLGGYPGDEDKAREVFPKLDQAKTREDFVEAAIPGHPARLQQRHDPALQQGRRGPRLAAHDRLLQEEPEGLSGRQNLPPEPQH